MSGEQYAVLAYAAGLGLVAAYSARLWAIHRGLMRRERGHAAAAPPPGGPAGLGALRVETPVRVEVRPTTRAGETAPASAHV